MGCTRLTAMAFMDEFIERGDARKSTKDIALAKSLLNTADSDLRFVSSLEITPDSARKITANYYDVARSLVEAIAALNRLKIYKHEGFTAFLKGCGRNYLAENFDRFRKIRNGIEYFGNNVSAEETRQNVEDMKELIAKLRKQLSEELEKSG